MASTTTVTDTHGETASGAEAGTEAHTEHPADAHGGGVFPPMDTTKYPSQIFWLIVFFGLMYWLMKRILPRIGQVLEARKAKIDGDLARAQALKDETEAAIKAYDKSLSDARSNANDIAKQTREAVTKDVDAEVAKVNASLSTRIADAEARIAKSKATAMSSIETIAAEAANDIVASLSGSKTAKVAKG
jgi:F-type H+-transporting ATPase subunit b